MSSEGSPTNQSSKREVPSAIESSEKVDWSPQDEELLKRYEVLRPQGYQAPYEERKAFGRFVEQSSEKFSQAAALKLLEEEHGEGGPTIIRNLSKVEITDELSLARAVVNRTGSVSLLGALHHFSEKTRNEVAPLIIENHSAPDMLKELNLFSGEARNMIIEAAFSEPSRIYDFEEIIDHLEWYPPRYHQQAAELIAKYAEYRDRYQKLFKNFDKFENVNPNPVVHRLLSSTEQIKDLMPYLRRLKGLTEQTERQILGVMLKDHRRVTGLLPYLDQFSHVSKDEIVRTLWEKDSWDVEHWAGSLLKDFTGLSRETCTLFVNGLIKYNDDRFAEVVSLNSSFSPPLVPKLANFATLAGAYASFRFYHAYITNGESEEWLKERVDSLERAIMKSDPEAIRAVLDVDEGLLSAAKTFTRYEISQWRPESKLSFEYIVQRYLAQRSMYAPLPPEYAAGSINAYKRGKKSHEQYAYTPEFRERWKTLLTSLREAEECLEQPDKLLSWYFKFQDKVSREKQELETALTKVPNELARKNIEERLQDFNSLDLGSIEGTADAFRRLYNRKKDPELAEICRVFGLYGAYSTAHQEESRPTTFRDMELEQPGAEDISKVADFVGHVAHQEVWEQNKAFADPKVQQALANLFHTKALDRELGLLQQGTHKGKEQVTIDIIPARNLLTEFSGYMADACWTSESDILDRFPNISSLTFMIKGKVAGACVLIDATTKSGTPITIIRGLNPLESVINGLDMESFVTALKEYAGSISKERGRKLAIVIDDNSGGPATNRPMLFAYLSGLKKSLKPVKGLKKKETTFNDYDITQDTYYL